MNEETKQYMKRTIERLEAIHNSSTPWNVRGMLKELITKLKTVLEEKTTISPNEA